MNVIIAGFGTVGQGLAELLLESSSALRRLYGISIKVVGIVDSGGAALSSEGISLEEALMVKRREGTVARLRPYGNDATVSEAIESVEAQVLIEVTQTNLRDGEPGMTHIRSAIQHGLNVITANKGPLALALPSLKELAQHKGVQLRFSGAVGGGLPVIAFARECVKGDEITKLEGILNGTTNYILTMMEVGMEMDEALKDAQAKGYAERDPTLDVSGLDTACKTVILANEVMGRRVTLSDVRVSGIEDVRRDDVINAGKEGFVIRLLGVVERDRINVGVARIRDDDPLAVRYTYNAVAITMKNSGRHIIIGRGAGGRETATAILRDIISLKEHVVSKYVA